MPVPTGGLSLHRHYPASWLLWPPLQPATATSAAFGAMACRAAGRVVRGSRQCSLCTCPALYPARSNATGLLIRFIVSAHLSRLVFAFSIQREDRHLDCTFRGLLKPLPDSTHVGRGWACTLAERAFPALLSSSASTVPFRLRPAFGVATRPLQPGPGWDFHPLDHCASIAHRWCDNRACRMVPPRWDGGP
jgi:hypothetical protein